MALKGFRIIVLWPTDLMFWMGPVSNLSMALRFEEGMWINESKLLEILSFGESPELARASFIDDFTMVWREISGTRDEDLTTEALRLKRNLHEIVESITPTPWV